MADKVQGFRFKGKVFIDFYNKNGAKTGYRDPINATVFGFTQESDEQVRPGSGDDNNGQALNVIYDPKPIKLKISFDEAQDFRDVASMGDLSLVTQASSTFVEKTVVAISGKRVELGLKYILDSSFTAGSATGLSDYVRGVDYDLNPVSGLFKTIEGGGISNGATVFVNGDLEAFTGEKVSAATNDFYTMRIRAEGVNMASSNKKVTVFIPECVCSMKSESDLMKKEFKVSEFEGIIKKLSTETAPYYLEYED